MVILKADPSRNIRNAREIKLTIKNGKFYDRSFYHPVRIKSYAAEMPEKEPESPPETDNNEKKDTQE